MVIGQFVKSAILLVTCLTNCTDEILKAQTEDVYSMHLYWGDIVVFHAFIGESALAPKSLW